MDNKLTAYFRQIVAPLVDDFDEVLHGVAWTWTVDREDGRFRTEAKRKDDDLRGIKWHDRSPSSKVELKIGVRGRKLVAIKFEAPDHN